MNKLLWFVISILLVSVILVPIAYANYKIHYSVKVTIDEENNKFIYIVNDKKRTNNLLRNLPCRKKTDSDEPTKSLLFVHENVSVSKIINTIGIILKAGCGKPDIYYFNKEKTRIVEISFSQAKQYEANSGDTIPIYY